MVAVAARFPVSFYLSPPLGGKRAIEQGETESKREIVRERGSGRSREVRLCPYLLFLLRSGRGDDSEAAER